MLLPFVSCAIFAGWCTSFNFVEMEYQTMIVSERKRLNNVQQRFPIVKSNLLISVMICCLCDVKLPGIAGINPLPRLHLLYLFFVFNQPGGVRRRSEREPENAAVSWWYKLTGSFKGKKPKIIRSRLLQFIDVMEKMMPIPFAFIDHILASLQSVFF